MGTGVHSVQDAPEYFVDSYGLFVDQIDFTRVPHGYHTSAISKGRAWSKKDLRSLNDSYDKPISFSILSNATPNLDFRA